MEFYRQQMTHPRGARLALVVSVALLALTLSACSAFDKVSEPFLSILTGEELDDVSGASLVAPDIGPEAPRDTMSFETGFGRPLIVIRYGVPPSEYEQPFNLAIGRVLETRAVATFDVVAVSPPPALGQDIAAHADIAVGNATSVMESLVAHGVDPAAIEMNAITNDVVNAGEVHIYVR